MIMKNTLLFLLGLALLSAGIPAFAQPALSGELSGELGPGTFIVDGDCFVNEDATLEILAGSELNFIGAFNFTVLGELTVNGTAENPVVFTTDLEDNPSGWAGIRFYQGALPSSLTHCHIEHAIADGIAPDCFGGGVYLNRCDVVFDHCEFHHNTARYGGGIYCYVSDPVFNSCRFSDNTATELGGAVYASSSTFTFDHCVLASNSAAEGGGVYAFLSDITLSQCTLYGNRANIGAGAYNRRSSYYLVNCIVAGCERGESLYAGEVPYYRVNNCDFFANVEGNIGGEGWHPGIGLILRTNPNGDPCDFFYNIFLDPMMANPDQGDFRLVLNSPCIDAGDPTLPLDEDGTVSDIGVFYFDQSGEQPIRLLIPLRGNYFELVSTCTAPPDLNAQSVFSGIPNLAIVYQDDGGIFIPPGTNTIGDIDLTEGYQIFCTSPSRLLIEGSLVDPAMEFTLQANRWNWLAYPFPYDLPVDQALEPIAEVVEILLDDEGNLWIPGVLNTLHNLSPGRGYLVFVNEDMVFQYQPQRR